MVESAFSLSQELGEVISLLQRERERGGGGQTEKMEGVSMDLARVSARGITLENGARALTAGLRGSSFCDLNTERGPVLLGLGRLLSILLLLAWSRSLLTSVTASLA